MSNILLLGSVGPTEIIVILLLVLLLFGAKRIPEIAQSLGKGIREFKRSMREIETEIEAPPPKITNGGSTGQADKKDEKPRG